MPAATSHLLEREAELESIGRFVEGSQRGAGAVLLVEGPAGIGKTRLLEAAREAAARRGHVVLTARGGELERDFAFGVVRQLFEPELRRVAEEERSSLLEGAAALAAPVIGWTEEPGGGQGRTDRLFPALHGLFWLCANMAARRPLLLEVDDAHWADEQSLLWLAYLARRLDDVGVLITIAVRTGEPQAAPGVLAAIRAEPVTHALAPLPLSERAVETMVQSELGVAPVPAFVDACHERSAGNPFVLGELIAALAEWGLPADEEQSAARVGEVHPDTVSRSVLSRLERRPRAAVELARAVAILGSGTQLVQAARLAELDERDAAVAAEELSGAGFLAEGVPLRFAHPLIREAVYGDLPSAGRVLWHRRAADLLTAGGATPELVAAQLLESEPHGDGRAVESLRDAAARATARGASGTAVRYLARALSEPPPLPLRGEVLVALGEAEVRVGSEHAVGHLEEALSLGGTSAVTAAAASALALAFASLGRMPDSIATLERGIELIPSAERELRLRLEGELGALGQIDVSMTPRVGRRLGEIAAGLTGATPAERLVLAGYAHLRSIEGAEPEELNELVERTLSGGSLLRDQSADSPVVYLFIYAVERAERQDLVSELLDEAVGEARSRGSVLGLSIALAARGFIRWLRGDLGEAEADGRASTDAQLEAGWASVLPLAVATVAECRLEDGDAAAAAELFERAGLGGPMPDLLMHRWALVSRGRARIAAGAAEQGMADLLECGRLDMGPRASVAMLWRCHAALALAATGELDRAAALAAEQLDLARAGKVPRPHGVALRTAGLLSDGDRQLALLEEAVTVLERSPARLEHARALVELGAALRRRNRRRDGRVKLEAGYELARRCRSAMLTEQARQELAASGVRLRREALEGVDSLTPSERRVAGMASTGMSNPEIAQALFVSRKTIEMHLGRSYRKLDVAGREALPVALAGAADGAT